VQRLVAAFKEEGGLVQAGTPVLGVQRVVSAEPGGACVGAGLATVQGVQWFDQVVLACHSDQALTLLGEQATVAESCVLGAIRYQSNRAVLHTDTRLMPRHARAWAAWNYERAALDADDAQAVCLHYWINRLQPLPWQQPVIVSLNPLREPRPETVMQSFDYAHPVFDQAALQAQQQLPRLQGQARVWFCGAWARHGFHEDGLTSGQGVAQALAAQVQQQVQAA
jgi:predicted NAD/FAD-binding protein